MPGSSYLGACMGMYFPSDLGNLFMRRDAQRRRESSYDTSGGNDDRLHIEPGQTHRIADIQGPGCISHLWMTMASLPSPEAFVNRKVVLHMYWDGEEAPSVEAPIGDFFGMGHGMTRNFVSEPLQMSPQDGKGMNCWFPMPFHRRARIEVTNQGEKPLMLYYYIDYELWDALPAETLYFHAAWHRECPTRGVDDRGMTNREFAFGGRNTTGEGNYTVLEAEGAGHYVGCNLNIHNLRESNRWDWPGEGDDMIFVDGEHWPPRIHGTGTEDYVNMAWCPQQEYSAPYHGLVLGGRDNWKGQITYYRYHIRDPITFQKSIRVTIEHGHNNHRSDDWSSTAYWYQTEPHRPFDPLPPVENRLPVDEAALAWGEEPRQTENIQKDP